MKHRRRGESWRLECRSWGVLIAAVAVAIAVAGLVLTADSTKYLVPRSPFHVTFRDFYQTAQAAASLLDEIHNGVCVPRHSLELDDRIEHGLLVLPASLLMVGLAWNRNRVVVRSVSFAADEIAAWKEETKSEDAIEFMHEGSCCPTHTTFAAAIRFYDLDIVHVDPPPGQGLGLPLS
eukprot:CAMPEP_0185779544 /NCGR_PEP_ID=MMETSP1174-20130828/96134_1 /TAXON_ID=35687 /ORGANISM="Dictyocha speculum, Strain CCMP1381" /LENGTH=177 /DNA_ID=CAMNT_0028468741 /DNA_START=594 /DNA_END=1128 /DNA_ORIENTATION=-